MATDTTRFQAIISHCKEYGFVFPSSEIYDGLSAVYDYGQYGSELKKNIKDHWWKSMTQLQENIVGIDAAIFMHPTTWKASGHVDNFSDPMIDWNWIVGRGGASGCILDSAVRIGESGTSVSMLVGNRRNRRGSKASGFCFTNW